MDPQQRLLLERGYEALHLGALRRQHLQGSDGAVFVGIEISDWMFVKAFLPSRDAYNIGDVNSVASGRLSFVLGMHGPCKSIDSACSSGLSAAHSATSAVRSSRESSFAMAAAVSLKLRPHGVLGLVAAGTVSVSCTESRERSHLLTGRA